MNVADIDGSTPLHVAAYSGHKDIIEVLIGAGADPHTTNNKGETPLDVASKTNSAALGVLVKAQKIQHDFFFHLNKSLRSVDASKHKAHVIRYIKDSPLFVKNAKNKDACPSLYLAVESGH